MRKAFRAEEGNTLVVADYGQLELRLLAHMARCDSMLTAFRWGRPRVLGAFPSLQGSRNQGTSSTVAGCVSRLHLRLLRRSQRPQAAFVSGRCLL